jgi:hypothetical protein
LHYDTGFYEHYGIPKLCLIVNYIGDGEAKRFTNQHGIGEANAPLIMLYAF